MLHLHFLLFRRAPSTRLCGKALWVFVLLGFCIFDHACHAREKAEGKMLVSLEYINVKLMFCFLGLLRQHWQVGGTFICVSQTGEERETAKPTW